MIHVPFWSLIKVVACQELHYVLLTGNHTWTGNTQKSCSVSYLRVYYYLFFECCSAAGWLELLHPELHGWGETATVIQLTWVSLQLFRVSMTHSGHIRHLIQGRCLHIATAAQHFHEGVRVRVRVKNVQRQNKMGYFSLKFGKCVKNYNCFSIKV